MDKPEDFACYLAERTPRIGAPIAIFAKSSANDAAWYDGHFDGTYWRAHALPERPPEWYAMGWRERDGTPVGEGAIDCRTLKSPPGDGDPMLLSADLPLSKRSGVLVPLVRFERTTYRLQGGCSTG